MRQLSACMFVLFMATMFAGCASLGYVKAPAPPAESYAYAVTNTAVFGQGDHCYVQVNTRTRVVKRDLPRDACAEMQVVNASLADIMVAERRKQAAAAKQADTAK